MSGATLESFLKASGSGQISSQIYKKLLRNINKCDLQGMCPIDDNEGGEAGKREKHCAANVSLIAQ